MKEKKRAIKGSETEISVEKQQTSRYFLIFFNVLTIAALLLHVVVFLFVANKSSSPWSGGGDAGIYVNLAQNISLGNGYSFAGTPTAFRAPFYPILLAGLMFLQPLRWRLLLRALQLCTVICTAAACGALAKKWGGQERVAFLFCLLMPTLLFFQTEILTESVAALLIALWWLYLCQSVGENGAVPAAISGICAGVASLERLNAITLVVFGPLFIYLISRNYKRAFLMLGTSCLMLAPWIVHNWRVFGRPLYSTHTGFALVEGVLSPTGRGNSAEIAAMRSKLGWSNADVETDAAPPALRSELTLDAQARRESRVLWGSEGLAGILKIATIKIGAFWFSTDQVFATATFALRLRVLRWVGVAAYLIFLALAALGWFFLVRIRPQIAWLLFGFAVFVTVLHLPLTMNTCLRVPFFDPLIASLAAVGVSSLLRRRAAQEYTVNS